MSVLSSLKGTNVGEDVFDSFLDTDMVLYKTSKIQQPGHYDGSLRREAQGDMA